MVEYTREGLAIEVARHLRADDVVHRLTELYVQRGAPEYIRSDNGLEFTVKAVRQWMARVRVRTLFVEPGSPWETGYNESFNGKLRDEVPNGEFFDTVREVQAIIDRVRQTYNHLRPHSALGYRSPAPEVFEPRKAHQQCA